MILGIDATNLISGGGLTHIKNFIHNLRPKKYGFSKIIIFASKKTLDCLNEEKWLVKIHYPIFDKTYIYRAYWQFFHLGNEAKKYRCNILFTPGGSFITSFRPIITMSRNSLPF